jgi:predicted  nucleic acid-binding Zn-ribbon protein
MDEDFTTETKLDLLQIELDSIAKDIQAIEDGLDAIQKKYGKGSHEIVRFDES